MRRLLSHYRLAALLAASALVVACSGTPTHNPTTFPFQIDQAKLDANPIKTVVIAHVNLGSQSRNYLEKEAPRIDASVAQYLKDNGFKVLSQRDFEQHWNTAVRAFGNPIDPTSGKLNRKTFPLIMHQVRDEMQASTKLDAFIFTDLVELEVASSGGPSTWRAGMACPAHRPCRALATASVPILTGTCWLPWSPCRSASTTCNWSRYSRVAAASTPPMQLTAAPPPDAIYAGAIS
ncbi:MAG: hypothetical protein IPG06_14560 [Haliea sp.]|nr:hypothetical protein [Haliea sp.]